MKLNTTTTALGALVLAAGTTYGAEPTDLSLDTNTAYHAEVLGDASRHGAFTATTNEYAPKVFGYIQTRYNLNFSDGYTFSSEDFTNGFELTRTRLGVKGQIHPRVAYEVEGEFSSSGGTFTLLDGFSDITLNDDWSVRVGQYKLDYTRELTVGPEGQLGSERSATHSFFSPGRVQGVSLRYAKDKIRGFVTFSDGFASANTAFNAAAEADYALTGRIEYLGAGNWDQFSDFTSWRGADRGWMIGAALHWQDGGDTGAIGGTTAATEILGATVDGSLEGDGWNLYGSFYFQSMDSAAGDFDDLGVVVQGGYFLTDIVEAFGRYDAIFADSGRAASDDFHTVTAGINYYLIENSQAARLTFEATLYLSEESMSPITPSTTLGLLGSSDEQYNLRAQLQIVF